MNVTIHVEWVLCYGKHGLIQFQNPSSSEMTEKHESHIGSLHTCSLCSLGQS